MAIASVHTIYNMYFPIKRVGCKVFTIPAGSLSAFKECIISGQLPKKIVVGCVRNTPYHEVYNKNTCLNGVVSAYICNLTWHSRTPSTSSCTKSMCM